MDKNYTINRKKIELTEQGKQELIEWALNYYDEQNQEPEAVDIVDVNIPVEQQQMDIVLKKLNSVIKSLDERLQLSEKLWNREYRVTLVAMGSFICSGILAITGVLLGQQFESLFSIFSTIVGGFSALGLGSLLAFIFTNEKHLKKKLDKQRIKQAKKSGKDLEIEFSEDEYTLLTLKKLYNELLAQNESIKNVLKVGV